MAEPLDFYFDFASPYAYLASLAIDGIAARHGRTVRWRPILLGAVFKITGSAPNMQIPLRGDYLRRDVLRCARAAGVPLTMPAVVPLNALAPSRVYYWLSMDHPDLARPFAQAIFREHWGLGRDVGSVQAVATVGQALGLDGCAIAAACENPAVKAKLREETDGAVRRGVFGAPFIFVDGEPFWGADRLGDVERWLIKGGW